MTRFKQEPTFAANVPGPWGVDSIGRAWYIVHRGTLKAKAVGPVGSKRTNYFDRAMALADERNQKLATRDADTAFAHAVVRPAKSYVSGGSEYLYPKAGDPVPPGGAKVLLLTVGGICTIGSWSSAHVAWAPLPTRNKEKEKLL